jgi:hypothetical protein
MNIHRKINILILWNWVVSKRVSIYFFYKYHNSKLVIHDDKASCLNKCWEIAIVTTNFIVDCTS